MSAKDKVCFFCNRENLNFYVFSLCSHRICTLCLFERLFTNHITEFQGQIKLKIKCKCENGYMNQKHSDIIELLKDKSKLDEKEDNENRSENAKVIIEGCECSKDENENKLGKRFSDYFCVDCLKFMCLKCRTDNKNPHAKHRIIYSKNLIKYIKDNIRNLDLYNKTLDDFNTHCDNLSEVFEKVINNSFNNTINNIDELIDSLKKLKESYIKRYKDELALYIKTFRFIKIFYLNYYKDKNNEFKTIEADKSNIYKLKYLNNISYELTDIEMKQSEFFDKEINKLKKSIDKLNDPNLDKKLIQGKFIFKKVKKGYKLGEKFQAHKRFINDMIIDKNTNNIITASYDYYMKIWSLFPTKIAKQEEKIKITNLINLKNGKILASSNNALLIFELDENKKYVSSQSLTIHKKDILALGELEDGTLVSGSEDKQIILWAQNAKSKLYYSKQIIETEKEIENILVLNDFKIAYCGKDEGIIHILGTEIKLNKDDNKLESCEYTEIDKLKKLRGKVNCMCRLNQDYFVSGGGDVYSTKKLDHNIYIWMPYEKKYTLSQIIFNAHKGDVNSIILLRDGRFASSSKDRTIKIWKVDKSRVDIKIKYILCQTLNEYNHGLYKLIQLNDDRIVSVSSDNALVFWNNTDGIF